MITTQQITLQIESEEIEAQVRFYFDESIQNSKLRLESTELYELIIDNDGSDIVACYLLDLPVIKESIFKQLESEMKQAEEEKELAYI